jgi:hypothetical protein
VVKEFCDEKKIPYVHFPTIGDNVRACIKHLTDMGTNENPQTIVLEKTLLS